MSGDDFVCGLDRSEHYTLMEISMFSGRSVAAKKLLLRSLFRNLEAAHLRPPARACARLPAPAYIRRVGPRDM